MTRDHGDRAPAAERDAWQQAVAGRLSTHRLTAGRPFCAGVVITRDGKILATLSPASGATASGQFLLGGVGGGQEPGEDIWQCAYREATEELGVEVQLLHSPVTYLHDIDRDQRWAPDSVDEPAPLVLQRQANADPARPFKPGNPAGHYTYFGMFLARILREEPVFQPDDDDIAALVWVPLNEWAELVNGIRWARLARLGATIAAGRPPLAEAQVQLPAVESLRVVVPVLLDHPELWSGT